MTTMAWGEDIQIFMELGFPVNPFTLDDVALGVLDEDFLDGTLIGDDVSPYAQEVSISRGRSDQLQNFNAGTCSVRLLNRDRRFDPINESSPYWNAVEGRSGVAPRRKVTVFSDGVALFTGRITDIDVSYEPNNPNATTENSYVTITAADDFVLLANTFTGSPITPTQELSGTRVTTILDLPEVGYPATRDIDAGAATLGGGATFDIDSNTNVLTYLQSVAISEQGYFFVAANGDLTFTDRVAASFASPVATFSDAGTDIPYTSLSVMYGQEFLYNKVVCQVEGGTDQVANDVVSQTEYGISTLNLSGLLLVDDAAALTLATDLLGRYKEPEYRFDKLQTIYNPLGSGDQGTLTGVELADVVEITRSYPTGTPASVTLEYSIENIRHVITPNAHTVEFGLAVADLVYPFILAGYPLTTRTNLVTNPSFEVNTTGWSNIQTGTTNTRITTDSYSGTACTQVNITGLVANSGIATTFASGQRMPVTAGIPYMWSLYVKVPLGQPSCSLRLRTSEYRADGTQNLGQVSSSTTVSDTDGWMRLSFADTPTAGATPTVSMSCRVEIGSTVGSARTWLVDAALFEQSATLLPYFDGSNADTYTGYVLNSKSWTGQANDSASTASWYQGNTRTNLVTNPNFETNATGWTGGGTASASVARSTAQQFIGSASLAVTSGVNGTARAFCQNVAPRIAVTAGTSYTFSAYTKSPTAARLVDFVISWYNSSNAWIGDTESADFLNTTTGWTRITYTVTAITNSFSCTPSVRFFNTLTGEVNYIDAVLVEQTSSALPYFDGTYADTYTGYTLTEQGWNGTADGSTSTASWGLDSSFVAGTPMDSDYALT